LYLFSGKCENGIFDGSKFGCRPYIGFCNDNYKVNQSESGRLLGGALSDDESDVVLDPVEAVEVVGDIRVLDADGAVILALVVLYR
jgi:hypothetical protein